MFKLAFMFVRNFYNVLVVCTSRVVLGFGMKMVVAPFQKCDIVSVLIAISSHACK